MFNSWPAASWSRFHSQMYSEPPGLQMTPYGSDDGSSLADPLSAAVQYAGITPPASGPGGDVPGLANWKPGGEGQPETPGFRMREQNGVPQVWAQFGDTPLRDAQRLDGLGSAEPPPSFGGGNAFGLFERPVTDRPPAAPFSGGPLAAITDRSLRQDAEPTPWWSVPTPGYDRFRTPDVSSPGFRLAPESDLPGFRMHVNGPPQSGPGQLRLMSFDNGPDGDADAAASTIGDGNNYGSGFLDPRESPEPTLPVSEGLPAPDPSQPGVAQATRPSSTAAELVQYATGVGSVAHPAAEATLGSAVGAAARAAAPAIGRLGAAAAAGAAAPLFSLPFMFIPTNHQGETVDLGDGLRARFPTGQRKVEIERRVDTGLFGTDFGAKWQTVPVDAVVETEEDGVPRAIIDHRQLMDAVGPEAAERVT